MQTVDDALAEIERLPGRLRHFAYAAGWKKFEPLWDLVLRAKRVARIRPILEAVLLGRGSPPHGEGQRVDLATRSTSGMSLRVFSP